MGSLTVVAKCNNFTVLVDGVDSVDTDTTRQKPKNNKRGNVQKQKYYASVKTCVLTMNCSVGFSLCQ